MRAGEPKNLLHNVYMFTTLGNVGIYLFRQLFILKNSNPTEKLKELYNQNPNTLLVEILPHFFLSSVFLSLPPQQFESKLPR